MTVQTKYGLVEGVRQNGSVIYKGIPFAQPPVGEKRWRPPEEPLPWEGVYRADTFKPMCPQTEQKEPPIGSGGGYGNFYKEFYAYPEYQPGMSEDCLYLNIWVPEGTKEGEKLPVAFWIHGGGFGSGYSSEIEFDGEVYNEKGVILVTVAYRLHLLGFFAHKWLNAESPRGVSGNYGCLDQIAALKWVRGNIAAFGGDPENITVFGQSAGCMSTQVLISSELTGNMIAKSILQSGIDCGAGFLLSPTLEEEMEVGDRFVELSGCKNLSELRALPAERIVALKDQIQEEHMRAGKGLMIVPNVDGYVLRDSVGTVFQHGGMKDIPYIVGCVTNDLATTPEELARGDPGLLLKEAKRWAEKRAEISRKPVFVYHFSRKPPGDTWGAFHSAELWYMFGTLGRCWRPMEKEDFLLSEKMVSYWTNFMKSGDPNGEGLPGWKPDTGGDAEVAVFDVE